MNKVSLVILAVTLMAFVSVAGCTLVTEDIHLDLPFEVSSVENVAAYHYDGVPTNAEKKVVTEAADIEDMYSMFERISLQTTKSEETTGGCVVIYQFILSDGTTYDLRYIGKGVKNGILKSDAGTYQYSTSSDLGGYWKNLPYEAVAVVEGELPK